MVQVESREETAGRHFTENEHKAIYVRQTDVAEFRKKHNKGLEESVRVA